MKKYRIEVEELLSRIVEVDTYNIADTIDNVYEGYNNEEMFWTIKTGVIQCIIYQMNTIIE